MARRRRVRLDAARTSASATVAEPRASASGLLRASRRFYGAHQRSIGGMPGGFPFSTETCILIAKYEETCPVTAHLVGRVGAAVSPCGIDRSRPPGLGRAGLEGWHRQDAVGARRQRRLGAGIEMWSAS